MKIIGMRFEVQLKISQQLFGNNVARIGERPLFDIRTKKLWRCLVPLIMSFELKHLSTETHCHRHSILPMTPHSSSICDKRMKQCLIREENIIFIQTYFLNH